MTVDEARAYRDEVARYFDDKAAVYDDVSEQSYWQLSDELLRRALRSWVFDLLPPAPRILDAGGGTGRWAETVLQDVEDSSVVVFDINEAMLDQARAKQRVHGADRMEIVQGDLNDLPGALRGREFEAVLCFHNVLGFVEDPARTVAGLGDLLTAGGLAALVLPNTYHMAHFSIRRGQVAALADQVRSARGRFTDEMPDIHTFAPDLVEEMLTSVGLGVRHMAGFPCAIYPGYAETQAHGSSDEVVDLLADPPTRAEILASEWDLMQRRDAAGRGNNLLAVAARSVAAEQAEVI